MDEIEYDLKINYIQLTLAFEVLDLFSRGFPDFIAKRARLAPAAARGAFIPLQLGNGALRWLALASLEVPVHHEAGLIHYLDN